MKWSPPPLLCLGVLVVCGLASLALGWWFVAGLLVGWTSILFLALATAYRREDEGGGDEGGAK